MVHIKGFEETFRTARIEVETQLREKELTLSVVALMELVKNQRSFRNI
jgi:hypothetical protein